MMQQIKYRLLSITFVQKDQIIPMDILFDECYKEQYDEIIENIECKKGSSINFKIGNIFVNFNDLIGISYVYTDLGKEAEHYGYFEFKPE